MGNTKYIYQSYVKYSNMLGKSYKGSSVVYRSYNPAVRCSGSQANSLAGCFGDLLLGRTSLALEYGVGVILRTLALKSSKLASGTFLRLSGAYILYRVGPQGLLSPQGAMSSIYCAAAAAVHCCAAAAAAHTPLCNRVASYMKLWASTLVMKKV
ncbi:hypothetical protein BY996DRAFT_8684813 [Phakopsora pachyrhizi]|nr:hypothetical protein BY996DRAFT_8684813 [Phakopsora pachyrhizi]